VMGQAGTTVKGAYDVLVSLMVIGLMLPYLFLFTAAIRLSGGEQAAGQLRIPGRPLHDSGYRTGGPGDDNGGDHPRSGATPRRAEQGACPSSRSSE